jgi:hypothetical protein
VLTLLAVAGCQTSPLGGTRWVVTEIVEPDESDRAALADVETMIVEFTDSGKVVTTVVKKDGSASAEDDERFRIDRDFITITHPDYTLWALFRFEGDQLRMHSPKFIMLLNPVRNNRAVGE